MTLQAILCEDCGGSIAFPATKKMPECPFCGSSKQIPQPSDRQIHHPTQWLPFTIDQGQADAAFRMFAKSSFWYPKDIRSAKLELQTLLLPAWTWAGMIETHYNGQIPARSASGYRPTSGTSRMNLDQIWVPASKSLSTNEINQLAPFSIENASPLTNEPALPFEIGELTQRAATKEAQKVMEQIHRTTIAKEQGLRDIHTSSIFEGLQGTPSLVPIYIGVYRRNDKFFRIVVNGTTGKLIGDAPLDWIKIILLLTLAIGILALIVNA